MCMECITNAQAGIQAAMLAGGPAVYAVSRRVRAVLGLRNATYAQDRAVAEAEQVTAAAAAEEPQGEKRRAPAYCRA